MNRQEFIERTGYEPEIRYAEDGFTVEYDEYTYIEKSYMTFPGNKDEFCKDWLIRKGNGFWNIELNLRKTLKDQEKEFNQIVKDKDGSIEYWHEEYQRLQKKEDAEKEMIDRRYTAILQKLQSMDDDEFLKCHNLWCRIYGNEYEQVFQMEKFNQVSLSPMQIARAVMDGKFKDTDLYFKIERSGADEFQVISGNLLTDISSMLLLADWISKEFQSIPENIYETLKGYGKGM